MPSRLTGLLVVMWVRFGKVLGRSLNMIRYENLTKLVFYFIYSRYELLTNVDFYFYKKGEQFEQSTNHG